jgi:hypothetical protein
MPFRTATAAESLRTKAAPARPSAANASAPRTISAATERSRCGTPTSNRSAPSANRISVVIANEIRIDVSRAAMYVVAGNGVARRRLSVPSSRRYTSDIASAPKPIAAAPYPIIPASRYSEPRTPSICSFCWTDPSITYRISGSMNVKNASSRFRQNRRCWLRSSCRKSLTPAAPA